MGFSQCWFLIIVYSVLYVPLKKIAERYTFGDVNAANEIVIDDETMLLHML